MHITIIGASSGVGLLAVQQALAQGHHVTTLSRTVATLPEHPQLTIDTARALLEATAGAPLAAPVLVLTGFGAGASAPYLSWWMRLAIRWFMQPEYDNKTQLEELLAASTLRWEIVRPGMLTNGPLAPYQVLSALMPGMQVGRISRASVADFLLRQAQQPTLLYHYPALTS